MATKQWLVKSSGRILGPYSKDQIAEHLQKRNIVIIDEVSPPGGTWILIRDQESFADIIEKLVIEEVQVGDSTQVLSVTDDFTDTEELPTRVSHNPLPSTHQSPPPSDHETPETEYIYEGLTHKEPSRITIVLVSLLVISAICLTLYFKMLFLSEEKVENYGSLLVEGENLVQQGNLDKALVKYKEAYQLDSRVSDFHIHFGALLVRSGETVQARRILEAVLVNDPEMKNEVTLVLGLADLMDGDYTEAEVKFDKILSSHTLPTRINKSLSFIKTGKYQKAHALLQNLLSSQETINPLVIILLVESRINLWHEQGNENNLHQSLSDLQKYISSQSNYYQESLFMQSYLYSLTGHSMEAESLIRKMLNVDPYQTVNFKENIFINRSLMDWTLLIKWCQPLVDSMNHPVLSHVLKSYCDFKDKNREAALNSIESFVRQNPKEPLALSLYSFILQELSDETKALVELNKALEIEPQNPLALSLRGHVCERSKNMECSLESWSKLVQVDKNSLVGHTGLARYYFFQGDKAKSAQHYKTALGLSTNYTPLLELVEKLGK